MAVQSPAFEEQVRSIEARLAEIEQSTDETAREAARETVRLLLDLHAAGIGQLLRVIAERSGNPGEVVDACVENDLLRSLLLLHDLHPDSLESRVVRALDGVRPYLNSHGGDVELLEIAEGRVRLRLSGSCNGCPSSSATLNERIQTAIIELAPDVAAIEVDEAAGESVPAGLVELSTLTGSGPSGNGHPATSGQYPSSQE